VISRDRRSVGELLVECEHVAREALWDVDQIRAGTMLRTWGEVIQSATDLWHALPANTPPDPITGVRAKDGADITMDRLQAMTTALHRSIRGQPWPGEGRPTSGFCVSPKTSLGRLTSSPDSAQSDGP